MIISTQTKQLVMKLMYVEQCFYNLTILTIFVMTFKSPLLDVNLSLVVAYNTATAWRVGLFQIFS